MGLFDLFSNDSAEKVAALANAGRQQGYDQLSGLYGQGRDAITSGYGNAANAVTSNYGAGRDALTSGYGTADSILSNLASSYDNLYKGGATAYGDASGANGVEGLQRATDAFKNSGQYGVYGIGLNEGLQALDRTHAAAGNLASGNADTDAIKFAQDQASKAWGSYQTGLQPYLSGYGSALGQVGTARANNATGLATGLNTNYTGAGTALGNVYTGQANQLNASDMAQGNAANTTQTGIGQNNAGAELNNYNTSANLWNGLMGLGKLALTPVTGGLSNTLGGQVFKAGKNLFSSFGGGWSATPA